MHPCLQREYAFWLYWRVADKLLPAPGQKVPLLINPRKRVRHLKIRLPLAAPPCLVERVKLLILKRRQDLLQMLVLLK